MRARLARTWKTPKPDSLTCSPLLQRLDDQLERALDQLGAILAREAHLLVHRLAEIGARQRLRPSSIAPLP